jgi:hypothetical protein
MEDNERLSNSEKARKILDKASKNIKSLEDQIASIYPDKGYTPVLQPPNFGSTKNKGAQPEQRKGELENQISEIKKKTVERVENVMQNEPSQSRAEMRGQVERSLYPEQFQQTVDDPEAMRTQEKDLDSSQGHSAFVMSDDRDPKKAEFLSNEFSITNDSRNGREDLDADRD